MPKVVTQEANCCAEFELTVAVSQLDPSTLQGASDWVTFFYKTRQIRSFQLYEKNNNKNNIRTRILWMIFVFFIFLIVLFTNKLLRFDDVTQHG